MILGRLLISLVTLVYLLGGWATAQPQNKQVDFTASEKTACAPAVIWLEAKNISNKDSINWIVSNDTFKDRTRLGKLMIKSGKYDVKMNVHKKNDTVLTKQKTDYLTIGNKPSQIKINPFNQNICKGPGDVTFQAKGKNIKEWNWVIANTAYESAGSEVTHRFKTSGYKTVTLRAVNQYGCPKVKKFDSAIYIEKPVKPEFSASPNSGFKPFTTSVSSKNKADRIDHYQWDFNGANKSSGTGVNVNGLNYVNSGLFDVSLTLTTEKGCTYKATKAEYIKVIDSVKMDFETSSKRICPNEPVKVWNKTKGANSTGNFNWKIKGPDNKNFSQNDTIQFQLSEPGKYDVKLVWENQGVKQTITKDEYIEVANLKADFVADPACHCQTPAKIEFKNKTQSPHGGKTYFQWKMWDEDSQKTIKKSKKASPDVTYKDYGEYDVGLIAHHQNGCVDTTIKEDYVEIEQFKNNVDMQFETYAANLPFQFGFPEDSFCTKDSLNIKWQVFDDSTNQLLKTSRNKSPLFTFKDSGTYKVNLKVSTPGGCKSNSSATGSSGKGGSFNIVDPSFNLKPKDSNNANLPRICAGENFQIKEITSPKVLNYQHKWELVHSSDSSISYTSWGKVFSEKIKVAGEYDLHYKAYIDSTLAFDSLHEGYLRVNGVDADLEETFKQHCPPVKTQIKADKNLNHTYPDQDKRSFNWQAKSSAVSLNQSNKAKVGATIKEEGSFDVNLTVQDTFGCRSQFNKQNFLEAGVKADFELPQHGCREETLKLNNTSTAFTGQANYHWKAPDSSVVLKKEADAENQRAYFKDSGQFNIQLMVNNQYGCRDTQTKSIEVERVELDFAPKDTIFHCAPSLVDLNVKASENLNNFHWSFGDGLTQQTSGTNITHVYNENSGGKESGFDVKVKGSTKHGCQKTVEKADYITVVGPVPDFEMSQNKGCEPLKVSFKKTGKNYSQAFMDYGDRSNIDTSVQFSNRYEVKGAKQNKRQFRPTMVTKDSSGCYALKEADQPIEVHQKPETRFKMDTLKGCEPMKVAFQNETKYIDKSQWDFESNGSIDSRKDNPIQTFKQGRHSIQLMVESDKGCRDTLSKNDALTIWGKPEVDFTATDSVFCPGASVTLKNQTKTTKIAAQSNKWTVETFGGSKTVSNKDQVKQVYDEAGEYNVSLQVTNQQGCQEKKTQVDFLKVLSKNQEQANINFVTYPKSGQQQGSLNWEKSASASFSAYHLFAEDVNSENPSSKKVGSVLKKDQTQLGIAHSNKAPKAYQMTIKGQCGFFSDTSLKHRPPYLTAQSQEVFTIGLEWDAYRGWENVDAYKIRRGGVNSDMKTIATVDGDQQQYRDEDLCEQQYCYQIVAINQEQGHKAYSNKVCQTPEYEEPKAGKIVSRSTVKDGEILTNWEQPKNWEPRHYIVDRKEKEDRVWNYNIGQTKDTMFKDPAVNVNETSYEYRVRAVNHCDRKSPGSDKGQSILLKTSVSNDQVRLDWNAYQAWEKAVKTYEIQVKKGEKGFETIGQTQSSKTNFTDPKVYEEVDTSYEYRVVANGVDSRKSFSNTAWAVMPSRVFIPNAFSPNNDGLNDEFKVVGNSLNNFQGDDLKSFEMTIYNKWGQRIFQSKDIDKGWKGKNNGKAVPAGTYLYKVKAYGLDGKSYFIEGNVNVIR